MRFVDVWEESVVRRIMKCYGSNGGRVTYASGFWTCCRRWRLRTRRDTTKNAVGIVQPGANDRRCNIVGNFKVKIWANKAERFDVIIGRGTHVWCGLIKVDSKSKVMLRIMMQSDDCRIQNRTWGKVTQRPAPTRSAKVNSLSLIWLQWKTVMKEPCLKWGKISLKFGKIKM